MPTQDYKGYKIVVKFNIGFQILKEYRGKFFEVSKQNFHFTNLDQPLQRACNYIDQYPAKLEAKFKQEFIQFCADVTKDPMHYVKHFPIIDVKYFLSAHKKLQSRQS